MGRFESGMSRAVGPLVSGTFRDGTFFDGTFCMCTFYTPHVSVKNLSILRSSFLS